MIKNPRELKICPDFCCYTGDENSFIRDAKVKKCLQVMQMLHLTCTISDVRKDGV